MTKYFSSLVVLFFLACSTPAKQGPWPSEPALGSWETKPASDGVVLIPQWHLAPNISTKNNKADQPQFKNQTAIYQQLSKWVSLGYVNSVILEGCEGDPTDHPDVQYNGWSLKELEDINDANGNIDSIQTHVGLKLITKYKDKAKVQCGDNLNLIKENQLALSDIRGLTGFKIRLTQKNLSPKNKEIFLNGARGVLKLDAKTDEAKILKALDANLSQAIDRFENLIKSRNDSFVSKIKSMSGTKAVVIGGLHIEDLKIKLKNEGIAFSIWQPIGMNGSDANLIEQLRGKLQSPSATH